MNKMNLFFGIVIVGLFSGCASMHEKLAKRVGCTKEESTIVRNMSVPAYEEYTVTCKNVEYSCKIAPFTQVCNPIEKPVAVIPAKVVKAKIKAKTKAKK